MTEPRQMQFNISEYEKWKKAGTIHLQKIGKNRVFLVKDKYDPDTGEPVDPMFVPVTEDLLNETKAKNTESIKEINAQNEVIDILITDLKAVE